MYCFYFPLVPKNTYHTSICFYNLIVRTLKSFLAIRFKSGVFSSSLEHGLPGGSGLAFSASSSYSLNVSRILLLLLLGICKIIVCVAYFQRDQHFLKIFLYYLHCYSSFVHCPFCFVFTAFYYGKQASSALLSGKQQKFKKNTVI